MSDAQQAIENLVQNIGLPDLLIQLSNFTDRPHVQQELKRLGHLLKVNQDKGFTLVELLVSVVIIGILGAIALPSLLNQRSKAEEATAQSQVGAVNRAQEAHRLENDRFASSMGELNLALPNKSEGYTYRLPRPTALLAKYQAISVTADDRRSFTGCVETIAGLTEAKIVPSADNSNVPPGC